MKAFVTGATGFIGLTLALRLADNGYRVHALCRSNPDERLSSHPNIKIFRGDILEKESLLAAMRGCRFVYHVAAYARTWAKNPETYYKHNVEGTINVMECAQELKVKKVVFTSSGRIFGPKTTPDTDESFLRVYPLRDHYERSKILAEEKVADFIRNGLNVVILYPTRVYGPGIMNKSNAITHLIRMYMQNKWHVIPGDGTTIANYVYVEDVVQGHLKAMEKGRAGERYIVGGINASYDELFSNIRNNLESPGRLYKLPFPLLKIYVAIQYAFLRLLGREPSLTPTWASTFCFDTALSSAKAVRELDYYITPLQDGIRETVAWLKREESL